MKHFSPSIRAQKKSQLYQALETACPRLAPWANLLLYAATLLALDLGFRWLCRAAFTSGLEGALRLLPFTLGWTLVFTGAAALLSRLTRRIFMTATVLLAAALCVVHGVFINMFRKFFSFADMAFAGAGAAFADLSYLMIRKALLLWLALCVLLALLAAVLVPPAGHASWRQGAAALVLGLALILVTRYGILGKSSVIIWDQNADPAFLYEDFSDSREIGRASCRERV